MSWPWACILLQVSLHLPYEAKKNGALHESTLEDVSHQDLLSKHMAGMLACTTRATFPTWTPRDRTSARDSAMSWILVTSPDLYGSYGHRTASANPMGRSGYSLKTLNRNGLSGNVCVTLRLEMSAGPEIVEQPRHSSGWICALVVREADLATSVFPFSFHRFENSSSYRCSLRWLKFAIRSFQSMALPRTDICWKILPKNLRPC